MSKLALLGGIPNTQNLLEKSDIINFKDLERKYLLETYESGTWDDWPEKQSMVCLPFKNNKKRSAKTFYQ